MKILGVLCFVLAVGGFVLAAEAPPADPPARELSPMMTEITAALETARLEVAALKLRQDAAVTNDAAMALAREIAQVKRTNRVEMMRIQLRYARAEGRAETAAELEEIITRMTAPPAPGVPVQRRPNHQ
jgi:hypothetical protein